MPTATIHVTERRYGNQKLGCLGNAIQHAFEAVIKTPPEDYLRIIHELPTRRVHTPSFLGLTYSEDFIVLELAFIVGPSKDVKLALLKELNRRVVEEVGISKDDIMILLYELRGENISFSQWLAQRACISAALAQG
jgi:hypothetical protein